MGVLLLFDIFFIVLLVVKNAKDIWSKDWEWHVFFILKIQEWGTALKDVKCPKSLRTNFAWGKRGKRWKSYHSNPFCVFNRCIIPGFTTPNYFSGQNESVVFNITQKSSKPLLPMDHSKRVGLLEPQLIAKGRTSRQETSIWVFPKIWENLKLSIFIGFSIINHPFWGTIILGNTHFYPALAINLWVKQFYLTDFVLEGIQLTSTQNTGVQQNDSAEGIKHWYY